MIDRLVSRILAHRRAGRRGAAFDGFDVKELRSSFMTPHLFAVARKAR